LCGSLKKMKTFKAEFYTSRNTTVVIDLLAQGFENAIKMAINKHNQFPVVVDDGMGGWAEIDNGKVVSATDKRYFAIA
jgi:hypothetical protein